MIKAILATSENYQALFLYPLLDKDDNTYKGGDLVAQGNNIARDFVKALELAERHNIHSYEVKEREFTEEELAEITEKGALTQRGV